MDTNKAAVNITSLLQRCAFTLAEVLITLVIIGVIAAATIPTLINNTKKQEYVAGLKKANSVLSQAVYKIGQNKGYPVGDYSFFNDIDFIDELAKVVSVTKKCNSFNLCVELPLSNNSENSYKDLKNANSAVSEGKTLITSDGQIYSAYKIGSNSYNSDFGLLQDDIVIWRIFVDINGAKKPNKLGYDSFMFLLIDNKGIIPSGANSTSDCNTSSRGVTCAAKVLRENAINY